MSRFQITRADGRSNADVLVSLAMTADPGHTYSYAELAAALSAGTDREWDTKRVQSAVRSAATRLLREVQRVFYPVTGVGYRLSHASDHSRLALVRERKSQRQLVSAVRVLQHTKMDELTPAQRTLHEAHLTVTVAIGQQVSYLSRKQKTQDAAIDALLTRVEKLEATA
jgi:hypothetical protein